MTATAQTQAETVLNTVKDAFAPVTEAIKSIQAKIEVPEAARDFVKRAAGTAKDRAADVHAGAGKATDAIESAAATYVSEVARISRNVQQAMYRDAEAFFAGIDKLASAKSIGEAFQIQTDMVRERGEVALARTKATGEYLGKLVNDGARSAQESLSKVVSIDSRAA
jgi:phasin